MVNRTQKKIVNEYFILLINNCNSEHIHIIIYKRIRIKLFRLICENFRDKKEESDFVLALLK